jgi:hypothetical protein
MLTFTTFDDAGFPIPSAAGDEQGVLAVAGWTHIEIVAWNGIREREEATTASIAVAEARNLGRWLCEAADFYDPPKRGFLRVHPGSCDCLAKLSYHQPDGCPA